jgi:hypothetical protein
MTRSEIKTMIRNLLAESATDFFTDAKLNLAIYEACKQAAIDTNYIRVITTSTTSTEGTAEYSYPSNALGFFKICWDGDETELEYRTKSQLSNDYPDWRSDGNGTPWCWTDGDTTGKFRLYPCPNITAKVIKMYSYNVPSDFSTDSASSDFPDYFKAAIALYACYFLKLGDPDANQQEGAKFLAMYGAAITQLQSIVANPTAGPTFISSSLRW